MKSLLCWSSVGIFAFNLALALIFWNFNQVHLANLREFGNILPIATIWSHHFVYVYFLICVACVLYLYFFFRDDSPGFLYLFLLLIFLAIDAIVLAVGIFGYSLPLMSIPVTLG